MSQSAAVEFRLFCAHGVVGARRRLLLEECGVTGGFTDPVAALHSAVPSLRRLGGPRRTYAGR